MLLHSICQSPYDKNKPFKYAYSWTNTDKKLSETICKYVWSGSCFMNSHRCNDSWQSSDWCVLDFDDGLLDLGQAIENVFCDYQHIIATTKSHTEQHSRFRVAIPWEKRISDPLLYGANIEKIIDEYQSDEQCKSLSHSFAPCIEIKSVNREPKAYRMEVDDSLKVKPPPLPWNGNAIQIPRRTLEKLHPAYTIGKGSRDQVAWQVAKDLLKSGMSEQNVLDTLLTMKFDPPLQPDYLAYKVGSAQKNLRKELNRGKKD